MTEDINKKLYKVPEAFQDTTSKTPQWFQELSPNFCQFKNAAYYWSCLIELHNFNWASENENPIDEVDKNFFIYRFSLFIRGLEIYSSNPDDYFERLMPDRHACVSDVSLFEFMNAYKALKDSKAPIVNYAKAYVMEENLSKYEEVDVNGDPADASDPAYYFDHRNMKPSLNLDNHNGAGVVMINVDLNAPDKLLVDEFKKWLHLTRDDLGIKPPKTSAYTQQDYDAWYSKKLIPYLLLYTWHQTLNIKVAFHEYGKILFPDEFNVDLSEKIRKTIHPQALDLLSTATIYSLEVQYGIEMDEILSGMD